jgi:hypothetical protein
MRYYGRGGHWRVTTSGDTACVPVVPIDMREVSASSFCGSIYKVCRWDPQRILTSCLYWLFRRFLTSAGDTGQKHLLYQHVIQGVQALRPAYKAGLNAHRIVAGGGSNRLVRPFMEEHYGKRARVRVPCGIFIAKMSINAAVRLRMKSAKTALGFFEKKYDLVLACLRSVKYDKVFSSWHEWENGVTHDCHY